jgi:hypothetical protein
MPGIEPWVIQSIVQSLYPMSYFGSLSPYSPVNTDTDTGTILITVTNPVNTDMCTDLATATNTHTVRPSPLLPTQSIPHADRKGSTCVLPWIQQQQSVSISLQCAGHSCSPCVVVHTAAHCCHHLALWSTVRKSVVHCWAHPWHTDCSYNIWMTMIHLGVKASSIISSSNLQLQMYSPSYHLL